MDYNYPGLKGQPISDLMQTKQLTSLKTNCVEIKAEKAFRQSGFFTLFNAKKEQDIRSWCYLDSNQPYLIHYVPVGAIISSPEKLRAVCADFGLHPIQLKGEEDFK
jgi:hypothetical protein